MASPPQQEMTSSSDAAANPLTEGENETIPVLSSITPSIFVPLSHSLLEPLEPPNRTQRLQRILESLDLHEKGVKDNLMWLFEREKKRILQEAKKVENTSSQPEPHFGIHPDEADRMIANMSAPSDPNIDYNIIDIPPPNHERVTEGKTLQEETVRQLMNLAEKATQQLVGYHAHMKAAKDYYLERLEMEIQSDQKFGSRQDSHR